MKKLLIVNFILPLSIICLGQSTLSSTDYESLIEIVKSGDTIALKSALKGKKPDQVLNTDYQPLLFYACGAKDGINVMSFLLSNGADPNVISKYGLPAHWAAEKGLMDRLALLLDYGFNPRAEEMKYWVEKYDSGDENIPVWLKEIILDLKKEKTDYSNYPYLEYVSPSDPLLLSAVIYFEKDKDFSLAKRMISYDINVDLVDKKGLTALLYSVYYLDTAGVSFLVRNNANVNKPVYSQEQYKSTSDLLFNNNYTPLHLLLYQCKENPKIIEKDLDKVLRIIELLLEAGADTDAKLKSDNKSVLQVAKDVNNKEIINALKTGGNTSR